MTEPAYTRKEAYVLRLHELLWQFIEQANPPLIGASGDVVECAEQVLKKGKEE